MKLAVFDFDSTLMDGETLEFLAKEMGIETHIKAITDRAMNGQLDFFESLIERVSLLKGLDESLVNEVCANLPLMCGAEETISKLKEKGYKVVCFSGGFKNATVPFAKRLGLDSEFSNILHSKEGKLTGHVGGEMMFSDSKGQMLQRLQTLLGISREQTMTIGDGANDLSMFKYADTRISFCGKPVLEKEANVVIKTKDLTQIFDYI